MSKDHSIATALRRVTKSEACQLQKCRYSPWTGESHRVNLRLSGYSRGGPTGSTLLLPYHISQVVTEETTEALVETLVE